LDGTMIMQALLVVFLGWIGCNVCFSG
jgi:hypothetical protein